MDEHAHDVVYPLLSMITSPADLRQLDAGQCAELAAECRRFVVDAVSRTGGHLGSNLGAVELTIAMHRVFDSPRDVLLFDTGHQAYIHKLLTGRREGFAQLRQEGGLSGYPNRAESPHDWIENSHASTALSYAHGVAKAFERLGEPHRRVVALVGDGALTGGMAYEALNNLGHDEARVCIVLNDNGRSYAPTVSKLSESLTQLRLSPSYGMIRAKVVRALEDIPGVGQLAGQSLRSLTSALRELVEPHVFFEALGIRYLGPIDGHDVAVLEDALAKAARYPGPIVLHALTRKGKGYGPAEADEVQCLHDLKAQPALATPSRVSDRGAVLVGPRSTDASYTEAFSKAVLDVGARDERVVAITAAMPGPTGLLPFEARYPERFIDVGIAESHAMTSAAGMAMAGLRPVVAIYSTFLSRCFDQQNLDVGLHGAPVVICADRAGVTGDDGPSHHGLLDMVLGLSIPNLAVFAPAEPSEVGGMLVSALELRTPALIRYPKTPGPARLAAPGTGLHCRILREGGDEIVLLGIGKLAKTALEAAELLAREGIEASVIDPRVIRPLDPALLGRASGAQLVVTAEDGLLHGGAGAYIAAEIDAASAAASVRGPLVVRLGVPTRYVPHGKPDVILARLGLDATGMASSVRGALARLQGSAAEPAMRAAGAGAGRGAGGLKNGQRGRVAR